MIYFLRRADGAIKIGYTRGSGEGRKAHWERVCGPLDLLGIMDGEIIDEQILQRDFSAARINKKNVGFKEWFNPVPELIQYIQEHAQMPTRVFVRGKGWQSVESAN